GAVGDGGLQAGLAEAADVDAERELALGCDGPEAVVLRGGLVAPVRERRDQRAPVAVRHRPLELGDRVVDAGRGDDRLRDQPPARRLAELEQPLVVGPYAGALQLAV